MGSKVSSASRFAAVLAVVVVVSAACDSPRPSPSPTPAAPQPTAAAPAKAPGDLALEACDPERLLPCEHQAVVLTDPIAASGVSLTYSTEWADGRVDRPKWNADALGLGGWSLDVLQRYDPENGVLLGGNGSWRIAAATDIGGGERAVPTFDGFQAFVFDDAWRHVRTVDVTTGITLLTFTYDEAGALTEVRGQRDDGPVELTVERSSDGELQALVGIGATRTLVGVGGDGRLAAVFRPDRTSVSVTLLPFGLVAAVGETSRGVTAYEYDAEGRLARETDADGVTRQLSFDDRDGAATVTMSVADGASAAIRSEHVADVVRRTFTDTDGTVAVLDTNADGSTRLAQPDGTITTTGAASHPRWAMAAPVRTPIVRTSPTGTASEVRVTTTMGAATPGPGGGSWQTQTVVDGQAYVNSYDESTRTLTRTDPMGRASARAYDDKARLVEDRAAGKPPIRYAYDEAGRMAAVTLGEGEGASTTTFAYDTATGVVTELRSDGTTARAAMDVFGRPVRASTAGENLSLLRDSTGDILQVRPGAHPATSFGYSMAGRPTAFIPPVVDDDASYETATYTAAGQLASINGPGERLIEVTYDGAGRATSWTFDRGSTTATYDAVTGLLATSTVAGGPSTAFAYDGSVPVGMAWSGPVDGDVRVTVDGLQRATAELVNGAHRLAFTYDAAGFLAAIDGLKTERDGKTGLAVRRTLGSVEVTLEYDANGRLISTRATSGDSPIVAIRQTRDARGRIVRSVVEVGSKERAADYGYDPSGRLATVETTGRTTTYSYDESGNLVRLASEGKRNIAASYDDRDRLVRWGAETFRYAPDGTLLERAGPAGSATYDFDDLGALRSVLLPDGRRIEYVVDGGGRRIGRLVDGVLTDGYLYGMDGRIVAWLNGQGDVVARFAYDELGHLALVRRDGRDLVVLTDQLGSPVALIDSESAAIVESVSYDAWGNVIQRTGQALSPIGFAGGLLDRDTGLVHFGARDYDPSTERWTAPDPLRYGGGDQNLYRYAHGDPVNMVDPTGHRACAVGSCQPAPDTSVLPRGGVAVEVGPAVVDEPGGTSVEVGPAVIDEPGGTSVEVGNAVVEEPSGDSVEIGQAVVEPPGGAGGAPGGGGTTVCVGAACAGPGPGSLTAPGSPASCIGLCAPPTPYTAGVCLGACSGGGPGGGFVCFPVCFFGEPHLRTADATDLDFQAAGEFIVSSSDDDAFEIQARFEPARASSNVTRGTAVAVRVAGDRVGFYANPERPLVINGEVIKRAEYARTLPGGGVVERHGTAAFVRWPDGTELAVHLYARFVNASLALPPGVNPSFVGILRSGDGDPTNDLATREGTVIDPQDPAFEDLVYDTFADSWRISQGESLFDYLPGESTATFQKPEIPGESITVESLDDEVRARATALCQAMGLTSDPILSDCILDVGVTGDPSYAASAAVVAEAVERAAVPALDLGAAIDRDTAIAGSLVAGSVDRYHFRAAAGDIVYLDADAACTQGLDWRLLRPAGSLAAFGDTCTDIGRQALPEAGDWRLELYSDEAAGGPYGFRVLSVPAPRQGSIAPGQSASGTTTAVGEWHRYSLEASAGQLVYLDAEAACDSPLSWRLLRPGGGLATFATACTDIGRTVLDETGTWVIEAYSDDLDTGAYAFRVIGVPPTRDATVSVGASVDDATTQIGEWHDYRLTARNGQAVYLDALGGCRPGLNWRLLRPNRILATFGTTCTDLGRRVFDEAGEWIVEVYADDLTSGAYSFRVVGVPDVQVDTVTLGGKVSDTIGAIGAWHRYRLPAKAGQTVVLDATSECVSDLLWRLLRPDGSLAAVATSCNDLGTQTLDVAGDWVIEVYSDSVATGAYAFTVDAAP